MLPSRISRNRLKFLQDLIPNTSGTAVASYSSNVYCGQFSRGHRLFITLLGSLLDVVLQILRFTIPAVKVCGMLLPPCGTTTHTPLKISAFISMT